MDNDNQVQKQQEQARARENLTNVGKTAGKMYLEASGVPKGVSDLAVNQIANKPIVKHTLNKVADNPMIRKQLQNNRINAANNFMNQQNASTQNSNAGSKSPSASDELKSIGGAALNPKKAALDGIKNKFNGESSDKQKTDSEKSLKEKESEKEASDVEKGNFTIELKKSTLIKLALICSISGFVMIFFIAILSSIADQRASGIILGTLVGKDRSLVKDIADSLQEDTGTSSIEVGMGDRKLEPYYERLSVLGNVFSSELLKCGTVEECIDRPEFKYYLKVADIALRYERKHGIKLDWVLLNATIFYSNVTEEETMLRALNDYNEKDLENLDILMNLDWNYDYKKIPGYTYLNPKDFRYDLQILAKNMVKKVTNQTCTKCTTNADGSVTCVVTKSRTDEDIEDEYLKPGKEYYLKCDAGESYSISSSYNLDKDKYDEFLLEYIEHKYYLKGAPGVNDDGTTDMTPSEANGDYIFPLASGSTRCRSSAYGPRIHPITKKPENHSGDDYPSASGTPVYAVADGTVTSAANDNGWHGGMGNYVIINHGNGLESIYMHASKVFVKSGDTVKQGDVIMAVGTTGSSTGNHLHITFKLNGQKKAPSDYIGALPMCG